MSFGNYIGCLSGNGMATGNLKVFYDFSGGSGNSLFNRVYSNASQISSGYFIASKHPGVIVKTGSSPLSSVLTGGFNGNDLIRIAKELTFSGFTAVLDYEQDFCSSSDVAARALFSTNTTGISGFDLGVNQVNRLFLEYPSSNGSTRRHTSSYELANKNTIFLSHADERFILGYYDYELETVKYDVFSLNGYRTSDNWHLGGTYLSGSPNTGFKGTMKNFALFDRDLVENEFPLKCLACSGVSWTESVTTHPIYNVTGFNFSVASVSGITGYQNQLTSVPHPTGGQTYLIYESGVTGLLSQRKQINSLSQITSSGSSSSSTPSVLYDYSALNAYGKKTIHFATAIPSGYLVEIYSYTRPQAQLNVPSNEFQLNKNGYQNALLWQNGVLNLEGMDYNLTGTTYTGASIQGYDPTDLFSYNRITGRIIVTDYSGVWTRSRILINSGSSGTDASGAVYWPRQAQYLPSGDAIFITGVSGYVLTGYDLYLNGKKLVNDYDYSIGTSGAYPALVMSGADLPDFEASVSVSGNGNVFGLWSGYPPTGIYDINTPVLAFVERSPEITFTRHLFYNTGNPIPTYDITGYSEEVWVNGIKNLRGHSYEVTYPCSPSSGLNNYSSWDRVIYNNEPTNFNVS